MHFRIRAAYILCALVFSGTFFGELNAISQEEHLKHHPELKNADGGSGKEPGGMGGMMGGGMMGGGMMEGGMGKMMDGMMEKMGAPKPKDLYPSLMSLPDMPAEKRSEVLMQAEVRMRDGAALMSKGLTDLSHAVSKEDYEIMQKSVYELKEGLAQFDSGLAAKRALKEGKSPRNIALQWFKREMNLAPYGANSARPVLGGPGFHIAVILILGLFVFAMLWMYFFKMRRAAALMMQYQAAGSEASDKASKHDNKPRAVSSPSAEDPVREVEAVPAVPPEFPMMRSKTEPVKKWSGKLRVCRVFDETPEVKTFRLAAEQDIALPFSYFPGQFITLSVDIDGKKIRRSYTIASTPTQLHYCSVTVKREEQGLLSRYLHDQVKEGDLLDVLGPNGKFTFTGEGSESIVLIGGGVGITPLMSVVRYLTDIGWRGDIYLLYCCRTTSDFIYREELEQLQERHANLHVFATMTRSAGTIWMGLKGRFTSDIIKHLVPDIAKRRIHVCGPPAMMEGILGMLKELGAPDDLVETEAFGPAKKPKENKAPSEAQKPGKAPATVLFKRSNKSAGMPAGKTVLDAAEEAGVEIESSCLSGQCGLCKVGLISGKVSMDNQDSLSDEDKAQGKILACQATAEVNLEIDA